MLILSIIFLAELSSVFGNQTWYECRPPSRKIIKSRTKAECNDKCLRECNRSYGLKVPRWMQRNGAEKYFFRPWRTYHIMETAKYQYAARGKGQPNCACGIFVSGLFTPCIPNDSIIAKDKANCASQCAEYNVFYNVEHANIQLCAKKSSYSDLNLTQLSGFCKEFIPTAPPLPLSSVKKKLMNLFCKKGEMVKWTCQCGFVMNRTSSDEDDEEESPDFESNAQTSAYVPTGQNQSLHTSTLPARKFKRVDPRMESYLKDCVSIIEKRILIRETSQKNMSMTRELK